MNPANRHRWFSPARVSAIASNTLLEAVRLKVFYFLLIFALLMIGGSLFFVQMKMQEQFQALKDVSLGAMSCFTWLLATLATAMLLPKDVEDRTLYTILAKPVSRFEYLLGKLGGVLLMLLISTLVMTAMFLVVLYYRQQAALGDITSQLHTGAHLTHAQLGDIHAQIAGIKSHTFTANLVPGITIIYLKAAIIAAMTLLISTIASSWLFTIIISLFCYFIGNLQHIAREYWMHSHSVSPLAKGFLALVALVFPDFNLLNLTDDIIAGNAVHFSLFLHLGILSIAYIAVYTLIGYMIFAFKEL